MNGFHSDLGVEPVLLGRVVKRAAKGLVGLQTLTARRDEAPYVPAKWVLEVERRASHLAGRCRSATDYAELLPLVATVVPFIFLHRGGTAGSLRANDLWVGSDARDEHECIHLRETVFKGQNRRKVMRTGPIPVGAVPTVANLLRQFMARTRRP